MTKFLVYLQSGLTTHPYMDEHSTWLLLLPKALNGPAWLI